jgi:hypothetical protein
MSSGSIEAEGLGGLLAGALPLGPWGRIALVAGNLLAWAEGVDVGAIASSVSVAALALATAAIAIWERLYQKRREHRRLDREDALLAVKDEEAARKESLTAELKMLRGELSSVKRLVDDARDRAAAEAAERAADDERHRQEVGRLHRTILLLGDTVEQQAGRLRRFRCLDAGGGAEGEGDVPCDGHGEGTEGGRGCDDEPERSE